MFTNSLKLIKFILRHEKISIPIWIVCMVVIASIMPIVYENAYPTEADLQAAAMLMQNPALVAIVGPSFGYYTIGALFTQEILLFLVIAIAIMNIFFVVRHTRSDEELGRLEVVRSLPVGKLSNLNSTFMTAIFFNTLIAILTALGLSSTGVESIDLQGSLIFGSIIGISGIFFAAITALFSQLSSTSRGARSYSFVFLMIAYMVRAIGDIGNETLARISPLGLVLRAQPYSGNYWWPIWVILAQIVVVIGISFYLNTLRDLGAGFIAAKPGARSASVFLTSPIGLSWRLLRNTIIAWCIGMFVMGISYGSVIGEVETYLGENEFMQAMFNASGESANSFIEQVIPFLTLIVAILICIPIISIILKLLKEEKQNLTEHIFSRSVSRTKVLGGNLFIAFVSSIIFCSVLAVGFWLGGLSLEEPISFITFAQATLVFLPAIWVMLGLAVFLVGCFPSLSNTVWIYLTYCFFVIFFGQMLNLPEILLQATPFEHVPSLPIGDMSWGHVTALTVISGILIVLGFIGYRKRDIQG